jgi:mevalonate kinase
MLKNQFVKYTDACVENFLGGDMKSLFMNTKKLSKVVLNNFKPMIPIAFTEFGNKVDSNDYYLKIVDQGGGGYILGFTEDLERAQKHLKITTRSSISVLKLKHWKL